jgi:hypothetical protein
LRLADLAVFAMCGVSGSPRSRTECGMTERSALCINVGAPRRSSGERLPGTAPSRHGHRVADPRPQPPTRLRSRHRLFRQGRADRSRLRGSLILNALVVAGAVIWWEHGHWQVAVTWAAAALVLASSSVLDYRRGARAGAVEERWRLRGLPGPGSLAVIMGMAAVFFVTLRFGMGWTGGDAFLVPSVTALSSVFFAWRDARRYRTFVAERPIRQD